MQRLLNIVRERMGSNLPKRVIPLHFLLPAPTPGLKLEPFPGRETESDFAALEKLPQEYFKLLQTQLRFLNRATISSKRRLRLHRAIETLFYPKAVEQANEFAKRGGIPDSEARQQILDSIIDLAQTLIVSNQILFQNYYTGGNFGYAGARKEVKRCASRILELTSFKQRILSMRYQKLGERDWLACNSVYYVMSCYEDVMEPVSTLCSELNTPGIPARNLLELFVSIQMHGLVDLMGWPTHLQGFLSNYLSEIELPVQVRPLDASSKIDRNALIVYCKEGRPPRRLPAANVTGAALLLDCKVLMDTVRRDCLNLIASKRDKKPELMPKRFFRLPEIERYVVSDLLTRAFFDANSETEIEEQEQKVADLRVYVGLQAVMSLLNTTFNPGNSERLADQLAKRSALIAEDHVATVESAWYILHQDSKMIRLRTQETKFTTPMNVGALLAYGLGDDAVNRPRLAVVARIFRPSAKTVMIDLYRLSRYAEPVMITLDDMAAEASIPDKGRPALLMFDENIGGWCLAVAPNGIYLTAKKLTVKRKNQAISLTLNALKNVTTDFYLFSTSLTAEQLGFNATPEYPAAKKKVDIEGNRWGQRFD